MRESKRIGDVLFIQGMTGRDEEGQLVVGIEAQARRAFERIALTLDEHSLRLDAVGRARVYLTDADDWRRCVAGIVTEVFGADGPPVTLIGVPRLGDPAALIEIEADVVASSPTEPFLAQQDRLDIVDLIYRYASRLDAGSVEGVMSCFTENAYALYNDGATVLDGSAQLREFFEMVVERFSAYSVERPSMHIMNNVLVTLDGDRANVETKALAYLLPSPEGQITARGLIYLDEVVREPDGWKIARRSHTAQFQFPVDGQSVVPNR